MQTTTVERIIAKIDNDFNPNNSDWIPRVAPWCIDVLQQLDVLLTDKVRKELTVKDRVARSNCDLDNLDVKVYDKNGCLIPNANDKMSCCGNASSTGVKEETPGCHIMRTPQTIEYEGCTGKPKMIGSHAVQINTCSYPARYNVVERYDHCGDNQNHNWVLSNCRNIDLNFDTDKIFIEYDTVRTTTGADGCSYPAIPNNGILIECIVYYCMYKMLCRGYKHPIFNLQASQYGTNPYYMFTKLKDEAERSILNDGINQDVSKLFRSSLFIQTYYPRG